MSLALILAVALFVGLVYRRARGELRTWQGWGTALCCGWLFMLPLFLPKVIQAYWVLLPLRGIATMNPLEGLTVLVSWFLGSIVVGLAVAFCATLLADVLVSVVGLKPARSSELAQIAQALRVQHLISADAKRRLQREFFVTGRTLETLLRG